MSRDDTYLVDIVLLPLVGILKWGGRKGLNDLIVNGARKTCQVW
jgi:hypothetical protein